MAFEQWYESDLWRHGFGHKGLLEEAWQAATHAERERCIAKCKEVEEHWHKQAAKHNLATDYGRRDGAIFCAAAVQEADDAD